MAYKEFTVDAALLQELGERLIGRPDIAIAELIKNAYDADASTCEIQIGEDRIVVADNGEGMDQAAFEKHYLRLGTQHKRNKGVSVGLGRPLTGAKGVGRLASQFLGRRIRIESCNGNNCDEAVVVDIDWSTLAGGRELNSFKVDVQSVGRSQIGGFPEGSAHGTRIAINRLKVDLDRNDIKLLGREVWSLRAPFSRFGSGRSGMRRDDPDNFDIRFQSGEIEFLESFDAILDDLVDRLWRARITGRVAKGRESDMGEVAVDFTERYPAGAPAETFADGVKLSDLRPVGARAELAPKFGRPLIHEVEFTIYVYRLEKRQKARVPLAKLKDYLSRFGNVSIYDAGFRLPYYGIDTDWLQNGADYSRRLSVSALLPSKWGIDGSNFIHLPEPRRLFGIVNINTGRESRAALNWRAPLQRQAEMDSWLEIQPGRDRLHDNDAYCQLQAFVRYALDLYANRFRARSLRVAEKFLDREPADRKYRRLLKLLEENRDAMPLAVYEKVSSEAKRAESAAKSQEIQFAKRISAIAPLAAAGMSALAMTHELNRETRSLESARQLLRRIAEELDLPKIGSNSQRIRPVSQENSVAAGPFFAAAFRGRPGGPQATARRADR